MDHKAALLALLLVSSSLAGCTGDPDGGGNDEIDSDALQDLFDEYLQDFINNTTITVINNYHNNTTYVVDDGDYSSTTNIEYNNTTINEGDETSTNNYNNQTENDYSALNYSFGGVAGGNGSGGGTLYLLDIQFTLADLMPPGWAEVDHRNNTVDYAYTYYDYLTNSERTDIFTIQCIDYYLVGSESSNNSTQVSYWEDSSNYWNAWVDQYNQTVANMLEDAAYDNYYNSTGEGAYHVRVACDENYNPGYGFSNLPLFEIPIPAGVALSGFYDNYFRGLNEYVWAHENYNSVYLGSGDYSHNGYGDMKWRETYYPRSSNNQYNAFGVDFEFETMSWSYVSGGWVGGDEDSMLSVGVDNIYPGYEYRLIVYFTMLPVVPLE